MSSSTCLAHRSRIRTRRHSVSTFLVDGAVAVIWRHEGGRVHWEPFEPLPRVARRELEEEAKCLAAFHAD